MIAINPEEKHSHITVFISSSRGFCNILSTAAAYFCVTADNDFLNDPHNLIYSRILLIVIYLYVPVPWPCMPVVSVLNHILGGHQKLSNAEKTLKNRL